MRDHGKSVWMSAIAVALVAGVLSLPALLGAGDLDPGAPPGPTMKTLDEIPPTWSQKLDAAERFVPALDGGAILDKETGLVWEQSPDTSGNIWASACSHCYQREVDGRKGWRLPTLEELASLVDATQISPALPSGHPFDDVENWHYWSATTYADDTSSAWYVIFDHGQIFPATKDSAKYVWCVRGGQGHDAY